MSEVKLGNDPYWIEFNNYTIAALRQRWFLESFARSFQNSFSVGHLPGFNYFIRFANDSHTSSFSVDHIRLKTVPIYIFSWNMQGINFQSFSFSFSVPKYTYTYPDPYENDPVTPNDGNLHWKSYILPHKLIKTRFWKALRDAYKSLPDEIIQGQRFLPYESYGTMLTRGHFPSAFKRE